MGIAPSVSPPPVTPGEFIMAPQAAEDEALEVGVLFVGGGPAGLAGAIQLARRLEQHPEALEALGEVPIAVIDKGRTFGAHQLSGAVVRPGPLQDLLGAGDVESLPGCYGPVRGEGVYLMTSRHWAKLVPMPPPFHNKGNYIFSLSQLCRHLAEVAEEAGVMLLPETAADRLLVDAQGVVRGVRTGDKGAGREGEPLGNFEPGAELRAQVTVLCEGTQGHLTGAAIGHFGLEGENPMIWELGVKEVWKVKRPLTRVIHTMGWPLRKGAKWREFGGSFIYPMGRDHLCIGFVAGLDYTDASFSVHDALQQLKTHPRIAWLLEGGERVSWGAKTIPSGGFYSLPSRLHVPGALLCGDGVGMVNVPRLKGVNYAMRSGMLAADTLAERIVSGAPLDAEDALAGYDERVRASEIWKDLKIVRNMRQVFQKGFFLGGALSSMMVITNGRFPGGKWKNHPDADVPMTIGSRDWPAPDGKLTFDKLSSVFASGNRTRDDQPNHIRIADPVPREVAETWVNMCPAAVYEVGDDAGDGKVHVHMTPSNCVHCGAITAKGGRLTPPEGGSGPEYTNM